MATAAQIEANRRNAQRSTGPKSDEGKLRVRCNAFKHGMTALTIMPVLLQEDPNVEFGMGNEAEGMAEGGCRAADNKFQVADNEWQMADGGLKMRDEQCEAQANGCAEVQGSEPMTERSSSPFVGHDSNRVIGNSTNDKIWNLVARGYECGGPTRTGRWQRAVAL